MLKAIVLDWPLRKLSLYRLPSAGTELGLHYKQSDYLREFGTLTGKINGYRLTVKPTEPVNPRITVSLHNRYEGLDITISKPYTRPAKKVVDFKTPDTKFNRIFHTKRARPALRDRIQTNKPFIRQANDFYTKWMFKIEYLAISCDTIYCTLRYGWNLFPYIPFYRLKPLIFELTAIAQNFEEKADHKGQAYEY